MRTLAVSTVTAAGEPRVSGVDGHFWHGRWVFTTSGTAAKARHLRARPAVSAAHLVGDDLGVFCHGRAQFLTPEDPDWAPIEAHLTAHYGSSPSSWDADIVYVRIAPHMDGRLRRGQGGAAGQGARGDVRLRRKPFIPTGLVGFVGRPHHDTDALARLWTCQTLRYDRHRCRRCQDRSSPARPEGGGRGPVGARLPRAAQPQRAVPRRTTTALNVRARIENIYAKPRLRLASTRPTCAAGCAGGASTPSASPGIDGGRTAMLEPHELDDEYFMLRVRIDGGQLDLDAAARASPRSRPSYAPRHRRHHRPAEHPVPLDPRSRTCRRSGSALEAVGLSTTEACGDYPRVDPRLARSPAIAADEIIDAHARRSTRSSRRYIGNPEFSNLPRKFKTAISGSPLPGRRARGQRRRRSSASSTPSTAPASTCGSAAACPPTRCSPSGSASGCRSTRCPTSGRASSAIFRDYGYRRLRTGPG